MSYASKMIARGLTHTAGLTDGEVLVFDTDLGLDTTSNPAFSGDVIGNVTGDVTGDLTGNVTGDVTGNVTGNLTGNVTGDVTGNVTGDLTGAVTGDVTGDVTAALLTIGTATIADGVVKLNLPTSDPAVAGQLWSNLGIVTVSAGI